MKATIYIRVRNKRIWKQLGPNPASWVNNMLEKEFKKLEPDKDGKTPLDKLIT